MDWLDGSPSRFIDTEVGGAVYRPITPIHRLTNIGDAHYKNRLTEVLELDETRSQPVDIGAGARGAPSARPPGGPEPDGRERVLDHPHIGVWELIVPATGSVSVKLADVPHVLVRLDEAGADPGVVFHPGGALHMSDKHGRDGRFLLVELRYLTCGLPVEAQRHSMTDDLSYDPDPPMVPPRATP